MTPQKRIEFLERVRTIKHEIERAFLVIGEMLYKIREEKLYEGQHEDFNEYLEDVQILPSVASRIIMVFQRCVLEWHVDEQKMLAAGGWSNVYEAISLANSKQEAEALLDRIAPLNSTDKRLVLREARTGIDPDKCNHKWNEIHIRQCSECGLREKIYNDN